MESQYRVTIQHRINTRKQVAHALCSQLDLSLVQHVLHLRSDHSRRNVLRGDTTASDVPAGHTLHNNHTIATLHESLHRLVALDSTLDAASSCLHRRIFRSNLHPLRRCLEPNDAAHGVMELLVRNSISWPSGWPMHPDVTLTLKLRRKKLHREKIGVTTPRMPN